MIHFVPVKDYRGQLPSHDLPAIASADFSDRSACTRGHVISIVKEHICVFSFEDGLSSGHDAALMIAAAAAGSGISMPEAQEGFATLRAAQDGLLRIDKEALSCIESLATVRLNTLRNNQAVLKGQVVAGVRIISRTAGDDRLPRIEKLCHERRPIIDVLPFKQFRVGVVATGTDVPADRMNATINPILQEKFMALGSSVIRQECVFEHIAATTAAIHRVIANGADMVVCAGGMNLGHGDYCAASIRAAGGEIATNSMPALPEAMIFWAWIGSIPVLRLPGSVLFQRTSVFDLVIPRFLAGVEVGQEDFAAYGRDGVSVASP